MDSKNSALEKLQRQLNAGSVSIVVLALLDRAGVPMYGYQLSHALQEVTGEPLPMKQGTLYSVLRSLEREGLLESNMGPGESGPARRYYQVTETGLATMGPIEDVWRSTRDFVDRVLSADDEIREYIGTQIALENDATGDS